MRVHPLGIYEKAMPSDFTWAQRFATTKEAGFDFVEISVDESDSRLARLDWTTQERFDFVKLKKERYCGANYVFVRAPQIPFWQSRS